MCTTKLDSRKVESDQGGLMSHGACHTLEDSSELNSENVFQPQPVFISSLRVFSLVFDVLHKVINSVYVQTLPTEQATLV